MPRAHAGQVVLMRWHERRMQQLVNRWSVRVPDLLRAADLPYEAVLHSLGRRRPEVMIFAV